MTNKKLTSIFMATALALATLSGCSVAEQASGDTGSATTVEASTKSNAQVMFEQVSYVAEGEKTLLDVESLFSNRDLDPSYSEADVIEITLADGASTVDGSGVKIDGDVITITNEGIYRVSGTLSDGQIVVSAPDTAKVQIVLSGVNISNSSGAAIYAPEADKVFITLEGSNKLAATGEFNQASDSKVDGVIFSRCDLTINGNGSVNISSTKHGIVAKDELTLVSGNITIDAAGTGMQANDSVAVASGSYTIDAGTDGIHAENDSDSSKGYIFIGGGEFDIIAGSDGFDSKNMIQINDCDIIVSAGDDGIHADSELAVNGGTIVVEKSYEGLEGSRIYIAGGDINITSSDDGLNATGDDSTNTTGDLTAEEMGTPQQGFMGMGGMNGHMMMDADESASLEISGGKLVVNANGDGLDSNGYLTISGGETYVYGPTSDGDSPIDYGISASVTGGTVVAVGSAGMLETFSAESTQANIALVLDSASQDDFKLLDASGNVLVELPGAKSYRAVMVSTPDMSVGETYTLQAGSTSYEVTVDSVSTTSGNIMGAFGMGGMGQGGMGGQMPGDFQEGQEGQQPDGQMPGGMGGTPPQGGMGPGGRR